MTRAGQFEQIRQDILSFLEIATDDLTIDVYTKKNLLRGIINNFFDSLTVPNLNGIDNLTGFNNPLFRRKKRLPNTLLRKRVSFSSKFRNKKVPHRLGTLE